jgi:hypothetical protein
MTVGEDDYRPERPYRNAGIVVATPNDFRRTYATWLVLGR